MVVLAGIALAASPSCALGDVQYDRIGRGLTLLLQARSSSREAGLLKPPCHLDGELVAVEIFVRKPIHAVPPGDIGAHESALAAFSAVVTKL